jgi:uncharacterized circularly permuted ATP-grasp superfamily protein
MDHFSKYKVEGLYDELLTADRKARRGMGHLVNYLKKLKPEYLHQRRHEAELAIRTMGITFTVYSEGENIDREWPYDIIPRVILQSEWLKVEKGLKQRLTALNHFIQDVYNDQKIVKDKVFPAELIASSKNYRKECEGMNPVYGVWADYCPRTVQACIKVVPELPYLLSRNKSLEKSSGVSISNSASGIGTAIISEASRFRTLRAP